MKPLTIVGAGGFARETAAAVRAINDLSPTWDLKGFVDDNAALVGTEVNGFPVIGPIDSVRDGETQLVVAIGNPANYFARKQIVERLGLSDDRYATLVHPRASIGHGTSIGSGTIILANAVTTADVRIGSHVTVMPQVLLTHDNVIGDYCSLTGGVGLAGGTVVNEGAFLGAACVVRGNTIGRWSLVGMGSVVLDDVPAGEVWVGSPARKLSDVTIPPDL